MPRFMLSHYAVAVHDLDEAVETYGRLFGLQDQGRGEQEWGGFASAELGYAGERTLLLMAPTRDDTNLMRMMKLRANERNPHGEGVQLVVCQADDPPAVAKGIEEAGGRTVPSNEPGGMFLVHPLSTHCVLWEVQPSRPAAEGERPLRLSHMGIAVHDVDAAEATYARLFGMGSTSPRWESEDGNFIASPWGIDGRQWLTIIQPKPGPGTVERHMARNRDEQNPHGEGVFMSIWGASDPHALAERVQAEGGRIIPTGDPGGRFFVHPLSTHGVFMEIGGPNIQGAPL